MMSLNSNQILKHSHVANLNIQQ
ncbi:uncharacterized protein METZ01_LOCUS245272 [marine metagenome]|uniref:Uncharacterized protein n=1 Tax=marine metagenome TaxID=408172 RepID=A0A382HYQ5_9ZZZZ